jgi:hypothetical protein
MAIQRESSKRKGLAPISRAADIGAKDYPAVKTWQANNILFKDVGARPIPGASADPRNVDASGTCVHMLYGYTVCLTPIST